MTDRAPAPLSHEQVRRRASRGAALLSARAGFVLAVGVVANVALALLLSPRDFGVVALGMAFLALGHGLAEAGFGIGLIRREQPPTRLELAAVNGVQLGLTAAVGVLVAAVAVPFGDDGLVVAAMVATLPITVLRTPAVIVLERDLRYDEIAKADIVEALTFYVAAIGLVAAGWGLWGVAVAVLLRALAGTGLLLHLGPIGLIAPRWAWAQARPLVGFGARIQGIALAAMGRDQLLNAAIAVVGGIAAVGVWNLAYRILRVPVTLLANVGRVAYPAMCRVLESRSDPVPALQRGFATLALATGVVVVAVVGLAPALPVVVGAEWAAIPETLLWSAVALVVGGPLAVIANAYFFAAGQPGVVLQALVLNTVVWFAVGLPLLGPEGVVAIGLGSVAGALVSAAYLVRRVSGPTDGRAVGSLAAPTAATLAGVAAAWAVAALGDPGIARGVAGAAVGELMLLGALALTRRSLLRETRTLLVESLRGSASLRTAPGQRLA